MFFLFIIFFVGVFFVLARNVDKNLGFNSGLGPFAFTIFFASIGPLLYRCPFLNVVVTPPDLSFYLIYFFCLLAFIIGGFVGLIFEKRLVKSSFRTHPINLRKILTFFAICCGVAIVLRYGIIAEKVARLGFGGVFVHGVEAYRIGAEARAAAKTGIPGILNLVEIIVSSLSLVFMAVAAYVTLGMRKLIPPPVWLMFAAFTILFVGIGAASGNRVQTVIPILAVTLAVFGRRLVRNLPAVAAMLILILSVVVLLSFSRDRIFSDTGTRSYERAKNAYFSVKGVPDAITYSPVGSLASSIGFYLGHGFQNAYYLSESREVLAKSLGVQSFRGLGFVLRPIPPLYYRTFGGLNQNSMVREELGIEIQWYGWFGNLLLDFGLLGVPFFFFVFGAWFSFFGAFMQRFPKIFSELGFVLLFVLGWSIIVTPPFASFIYWPFATSTLVFLIFNKRILRWLGGTQTASLRNAR